jgi:hypothetical protein
MTTVNGICPRSLLPCRWSQVQVWPEVTLDLHGARALSCFCRVGYREPLPGPGLVLPGLQHRWACIWKHAPSRFSKNKQSLWEFQCKLIFRKGKYLPTPQGPIPTMTHSVLSHYSEKLKSPSSHRPSPPALSVRSWKDNGSHFSQSIEGPKVNGISILKNKSKHSWVLCL